MRLVDYSHAANAVKRQPTEEQTRQNRKEAADEIRKNLRERLLSAKRQCFPTLETGFFYF
jgi:hypothetical protein